MRFIYYYILNILSFFIMIELNFSKSKKNSKLLSIASYFLNLALKKSSYPANFIHDKHYISILFVKSSNPKYADIVKIVGDFKYPFHQTESGLYLPDSSFIHDSVNTEYEVLKLAYFEDYCSKIFKKIIIR